MISHKISLAILIILISIQPILASHFIIGKVNDALDGTSANDKIIILWNPDNGMGDNLTDIIGPNGNSNQNNIYMVDCELLNNVCEIGDSLNIKVINSGDDYISETTTITVTGSGYDLAEDLNLNSPPNVTLINPQDQLNFSSQVTFNCSAQDLDSNLKNITLYGNWSTGWHANETIPVIGFQNYSIFTKDFEEGTYKWGCIAYDNLSISNYSQENRTFTIDKTKPEIFSITINESYTCGTSKTVRVNCTTNDSFTGIHKVLIEATSSQISINYSTEELTQDVYYSDILLDELGDWQFTCYSNDTAGNLNSFSSENFTVHSTIPELIIYSNNINFSNLNPGENEEITIEAIVYNKGCQAADNFLVGFYENDPDLGGIQIGNNRTISVPERSNETTNMTWEAKIGPINIFVKIDLANIISEDNESNNKANNTLNIGAWQEYYGLINSTKILSNQNVENLSIWLNESSSTGNIYITDKESIIDWNSLIALGRDIKGDITSNDFSDIDINLNMQNYNDSISNKFTTDGNTPKNTDNFFIHSTTIANVPIINSTNSSNFVTGILWDSSYDSDSEYSEEDNEKLVFVTKINKNTQGMYGKYDYEITIPVRIREQDPTDNSKLYFYYELI